MKSDVINTLLFVIVLFVVIFIVFLLPGQDATVSRKMFVYFFVALIVNVFQLYHAIFHFNEIFFMISSKMLLANNQNLESDSLTAIQGTPNHSTLRPKGHKTLEILDQVTIILNL